MAGYCTQCGAALPDDPELRFCTACGVSLTEPIEGRAVPLERYCIECGAPLPVEKRLPHCLICGAAVPPLPAAPGVPAGRIPFEERDRIGWIAAIWDTWRGAVFETNTFYQKVKLSDDARAPLLYLLIVVGALIMLGAAAQAGLGMLFSLPVMFSGGAPRGFTGGTFATWSVFGIVYRVVSAVVGILLYICAVHLCLLTFGGARRGFAGTLRTICYTASTAAFTVLPCFGGLIFWLWFIILNCIALPQVHETEPWRGALAALMPFALCCGLFAGGIYVARLF